jgi:hypothetical protein
LPPGFEKGGFFIPKERKLKYKEKLRPPKKAVDIKKHLTHMARCRKTNRKVERMRDEFKRPTRTGLPEESWQIPGQD